MGPTIVSRTLSICSPCGCDYARGHSSVAWCSECDPSRHRGDSTYSHSCDKSGRHRFKSEFFTAFTQICNWRQQFNSDLSDAILLRQRPAGSIALNASWTTHTLFYNNDWGDCELQSQSAEKHKKKVFHSNFFGHIFYRAGSYLKLYFFLFNTYCSLRG